MKRTAFLSALAGGVAGARNLAQAMTPPKRVQKVQIAGPYRFELDLLPAEPFLTPAAVAHGARNGMVALGGAAPVSPHGTNHHLVVHIYDRLTGRALTHAAVSIGYARTGARSAAAVSVPIVRMEAAGMGPASTHYGNNVLLGRGMYAIAVSANGIKTTFHIAVM
jgi:hypothetical protein